MVYNKPKVTPKKYNKPKLKPKYLWHTYHTRKDREIKT